MSTEIISALYSATETSDVVNILDQITKNLEMRCYAYWGINVAGRIVREPWAISSYPDAWNIEYLEKNYALIDPVAVNASSQLTPYSWGNRQYLEGLTKQELRVFSDAKKHGIKYGILSPIHAPGSEFAAISIAADEAESESTFLEKYPQRAFILGALAPHIHSAIRRLINAEDQITAAKLLSAREVQCLSWVAHGKSFEDISQILEISRNTVITHVNRAKDKLGVRTSQQAVSILIASGLVQHEIMGTNV